MSVLDMLVHRDYLIIASEFADGGSLKNWLNRNGSKAPSHEKALEMMAGILRGIEHLHSRNVVHRDLKPDNILLQGNFPRITDFGISRIVSESAKLTDAIGSPAYMSPESFNGDKSRQNDIWSAGVILYEMLSGDFPFEGETIFNLVTAIQQDEPKPLPESVSHELRLIVENALQKDRTKRFQTAREMRLAVEKALYKLRAKATDEVTASKDSQSFIPTEPIPVLDNKAEQIPEEKIEEPSKQQPALVTTQPEIQIVQETQPSPIEKTIDAEELEREKQQEREREIAKISQEAERNRAKRLAQQRKRKFWIAGGISGGILGLSLIGFLIASMTGNNQTQTNSNAAETKSENNSTSLLSQQSGHSIETINGMKFEFIKIPSGSFYMGSHDGEDKEKPVHRVIISRPFQMGKYEITQAQWQAVMGNNPSYFQLCVKCPIENVSWEEVQEFLRKLNQEGQGTYRLPTEAEWEYTARAGSTTKYSFGNEENLLGNHTWYEANSEYKTHPIGQKLPNDWGLFDMHGNVWEWVQDPYRAYPDKTVTDPQEKLSWDEPLSESPWRVIRGGGCKSGL